MKKNMFELRSELEGMEREALAAMLRKETEKDMPDDELVILILQILEELDREEHTSLTETQQRAWKRFQGKIGMRKRRGFIRRRFVNAAILVLVLGVILVSVPLRSHAGSVWKILSSWTDSIFAYVNIGTPPVQTEAYVFRTENPGLQKVHDAVVSELGVTDPVVPMWLPGEMELIEIERVKTRTQDGIYVRFREGDKPAVLTYYKMEQDRSPVYEKIGIDPKEYEFNGTSHSLIQNVNMSTISWTKHNLKCAIHIDCQEEVLKEIIRSIY